MVKMKRNFLDLVGGFLENNLAKVLKSWNAAEKLSGYYLN